MEDLCTAAVKEEQIEVKLHGVAEQWAAEVFTFSDHKQRGAVVLKPSDTSELMERLEDSLMVLGSMSTNRYSAPFRPEVQGWVRCADEAPAGLLACLPARAAAAASRRPQCGRLTACCLPACLPARSKLSTVSEVIEQWLTVQSMWMYMEAVFSGGDIVKQLPQEAKRFQNIDKNFMKAGGAWDELEMGRHQLAWC